METLANRGSTYCTKDCRILTIIGRQFKKELFFFCSQLASRSCFHHSAETFCQMWLRPHLVNYSAYLYTHCSVYWCGNDTEFLSIYVEKQGDPRIGNEGIHRSLKIVSNHAAYGGARSKYQPRDWLSLQAFVIFWTPYKNGGSALNHATIAFFHMLSSSLLTSHCLQCCIVWATDSICKWTNK